MLCAPNDVDIVLHVETTRGIASETARALESLGYELAPSIEERNHAAHRFKREESTNDQRTAPDHSRAHHHGERAIAVRRGRPQGRCVSDRLT